MLSVGIVGLSNVGKSTLFNALLKKQQAYVANYPFTTIEPNIGVVPVPDERLGKLAQTIVLEKETPFAWLKESPSFPPIVPATVKFVDIAGLVKGASKGAGLGNKFLSHIREVSVIVHVVRAFEDENIVKEGSVNPKSDYETVQTELVLADLATIQNSKFKTQKSKPRQTRSKPQLKSQNFLDKILAELNEGIPVREIGLTDEEKGNLKDLQLLTAKPEIIVLNVAEQALKDAEQITQKYAELFAVSKNKFVIISAKTEAELGALSEEEQIEYLKELGLKEQGLERLIKKAYETLGLISFFTTTGEKEVRAWTVKKGTLAIDAADVIHTDFAKKFIKAEVVTFEDFVEYCGWKGAREKGKTLLGGKDYLVKDGDVIEFKIGT